MSFSQAYSMKSNEVTLTNCDREPVHVPGCIQPFGVLLSIDPENFTILQISDNAEHWFGSAPGEYLQQSVSAVIGEDGLNALLLL